MTNRAIHILPRSVGIFITNKQNFAMLQSLTCIAFSGVSASEIFIIFVCIFQEVENLRKEWFFLEYNFFVKWIYCLITFCDTSKIW